MRFVRNYNLKSHQVSHTNERPYACEICKKRFKRSSCLKIHQTTHTGDKPFKWHGKVDGNGLAQMKDNKGQQWIRGATKIMQEALILMR